VTYLDSTLVSYSVLRKESRDDMTASLTAHIDAGSYSSQIWMEGYLNISQTTIKKGERWERKFFVLKVSRQSDVIRLTSLSFPGIRFIFLQISCCLLMISPFLFFDFVSRSLKRIHQSCWRTLRFVFLVMRLCRCLRYQTSINLSLN
jgi:hypothetical protein